MFGSNAPGRRALEDIRTLEARIAVLQDASKRIGFARKEDDRVHRRPPANVSDEQWRIMLQEWHARDSERDALMLPIIAEVRALERAVHALQAVSMMSAALGFAPSFYHYEKRDREVAAAE